MTITVFCVLLFAALLHASWNAIVKASGDKLYAAIGVSGSAALIALAALPFAPQPSLANVPYLVLSSALQVVYTVLVAKTYQVSDMSQTYPLMRGTAPLLVAVISVAAGMDGNWRNLSGDPRHGLQRPGQLRLRHHPRTDQRLFYRRLYVA